MKGKQPNSFLGGISLKKKPSPVKGPKSSKAMSCLDDDRSSSTVAATNAAVVTSAEMALNLNFIDQSSNGTPFTPFSQESTPRGDSGHGLSIQAIHPSMPLSHSANDCISMNSANETGQAGRSESATSIISGAGLRAAAPQPTATSGSRYAITRRPGDAPGEVVKGWKYIFDPQLMQWTRCAITFLIHHPNRGVDQDDLHAIFSMELLDDVKIAAPMFAKVFRRNIAHVSEVDYFGEGQCQSITEEFARQYYQLRLRPGVAKPPLPLLTNRTIVRVDLESLRNEEMKAATKGFFSYRTTDTRQLLFMMEANTLGCASVGATFASAEVDGGRIYPPGHEAWNKQMYRDVAEGFTHFTYCQSGGSIIVHGMQRNSGYLVDPLVNTADGSGYGMCNSGRRGIERWVSGHVCNDVCRSLSLLPLNRAAAATTSTSTLPRDSGFEGWAQRSNDEMRPDNYFTEFSHQILRLKVESPEFQAHPQSHQVRRTTSGMSSNVGGAAAATPEKAVSCSAERYIYCPAKESWKTETVVLHVLNPACPVTSDSHFSYFLVEVELPGGERARLQARFYTRPTATDAEYRSIGDAYALCEEMTSAFHNYRGNTVYHKKISFLDSHVVRISPSNIPTGAPGMTKGSGGFFSFLSADSGDVVFILEPHFCDTTNASNGELAASLRAGIARDGFAESKELYLLSDCFSHYTLQKTNNRLLICNFKCTNGILRAPKIHSINSSDFASINDGAAGIEKWGRSHQCNALCGLLGLRAISPSAAAPRPPTSSTESRNRFLACAAAIQAHKASRRGSGAPLPSVKLLADPVPTSSHAVVQQVDPMSLSLLSSNFSGTYSGSAPLSISKLRRSRTAAPGAMRSPRVGNASCLRRSLSSAAVGRLQAKGVDTTYVFPATKYEYDITGKSWKKHRIFVRICSPDHGMAQGGMRVCFEVAEVDADGAVERTMVAKMYRRTIKDVVEKDYFTEVMVQHLCGMFSNSFNEAVHRFLPSTLSSSPSASALTVLKSAVVVFDRADLPEDLLAKRTGFFSYRTTDTQRVMFSVEPKLTGKFTKYNGNLGETYPASEGRLSVADARRRTEVFEAVEALTHFSLERSEGGLLVCDMQGVDSRLTDLEIHTYDGAGLGIGNFGQRGISRFSMRHRCNHVCRAIGLKNLREQKFEVTEAVRKRNLYLACADAMQASATQDRVLPFTSSSPS